MSVFWGMDTAQLRGQADRLSTASADVERLAAHLTAAVRSVSWTGPDAEELRRVWVQLAAPRFEDVYAELLVLGDEARREAAQQDAVSLADSAPPGIGPSVLSRGETSTSLRGHRHADSPWLPEWLEEPFGSTVPGVAGALSDGAGPRSPTAAGLVQGVLDELDLRADGFSQFRSDAEHLGGILEDWVTGERVPTIAEVSAAGLIAAGSAGVGFYEAAWGEDTPLLDDRPGGIIRSVRTDPSPSQGPRTLQDLIVHNDALRMDNPGGAPLEHGQIGIQEVHRSGGTDPAYIVQVPPTEGAGVFDVPGSYGAQGNSRGWGSNLRLVAGQHPAAMDDVRAAMEAAGVPSGADVLIVGHSQGGIVANHLAADPTFNSSSGAPGTYDVTHTFSMGAPVQTVVPAQGTTRSVNVHHGTEISPEGISGDLIAGLDLGGAQVDGGILTAPNRQEVSLPGQPVPSLHPIRILEANHDSTGTDGSAGGGYAGSVGRATSTDPTLRSLQDELTGAYLGEGTHVATSHVVTVGRGAP